ncbi:MAG: outer membrane protein assembly factor BamE [Filomicrobium sp.]
MPRLVTVSLLALMTLVLAACVARNYHAHLHAVTPGMTKTEVQSHLGPPNTVRTRDGLSAWLYCDDDIIDFPVLRELRDRDKSRPALTIWFQDDRLADVSTYINQPAVGCGDFEQAFKWSDFPPRPNGYSYK